MATNADPHLALSLQPWDYALCAIYLIISVALGLKAGGRQKDLKTYLLAGNRMHWALIAISIMAALFSGISFLGAPAESYGHSLIYLWVVLAYFIATPVTTLIFLPFFYRLPFYTAYEYLEHRFDLRLRRISSALFIFRVTFWLALALYVPSLVLSEMATLPLWACVLMTGAVTLLYTTVGGLRAVIYTDVMQFCVLLLGIGVILWVALGAMAGGATQAWEIAREGGRTRFLDLNFSVTERMTLLGAFVGGFFINLTSLVTDQLSVQRYLSAASLNDGKRALWMKLIIMLPLVGVFYYTGLVLYAYYQLHPELATSLTHPDRLLPHFISHRLASPLPGLMIAAILAATMSTISAGVNSLTTATLMDFLYANERGTPLNESARVRTARLWTVAYGIIITVMAFGVGQLGTFIEASNKIAGFFGGPSLGIFLLGIFSKRANAQGTLIGAIAGFLLVVVLGFLTPLSFMWYAMVGALTTWLVGEGASRLWAPPSTQQQSFSLYPPTSSVTLDTLSHRQGR